MFTPNSDEISRAISSQELTEILSKHSQRINAEISDFQLSPQNIYCSKTGQPIGELKTAALYTALQIHGREGLKEQLYQSNCSSVHPAWVKTGSNEQYNEILDKLCEHEPYAYAVYALGFVTQQFYKLHHSRKFLTREHHAEFHWSLARAWQILSLVPYEQITELNEALCHMLTYAPGSLRYFYFLKDNRLKTADSLARLAIGGILTKDINFTIEQYLKGIEKTQTAIDKTDFIEHAKHLKKQFLSFVQPTERQIVHFETARETLKEHYNTLVEAESGPAQFRKQRLAHKRKLDRELKISQSKRAIAVRELESEFGAELFGSHAVTKTIAPQTPRNTRWSHIEAEMIGLPGDEIISPEILENFDMSNIALPGEIAFGENEGAEMRTISWAEVNARQAARDAEEKAKLQAQLDAAPKISFFSRIAKFAPQPAKTELPAIFKRLIK